MANKPLKSIKFPGLADTYTVPEIDSTLAEVGKAADAKKVGDELGDLKSALVNVADAITEAKTAKSTKTGKIRVDTGAFVSGSDTRYGATDLLPTFGYEYIDYYVNGNNGIAMVAFYDIDKNFISNLTIKGSSSTVETLSGTVDLTDSTYENVEYVAMSVYASIATDAEKYFIKLHREYDMNGIAEELDKKADKKWFEGKKITQTQLTENGYIKTNGDFNSYSSAICSDYIPVDGYAKIDAYTRLGNTGCAVAFYDGSKAFMQAISMVGTDSSALAHYVADLTNVAYADAKFVRISCYNSTSYADFYCIFNAIYTETVQKMIEAYVDPGALNGLVINALGDSITSTNYERPTWWEMIATKTGATFNNYGVSGTSIAKIDATAEHGDPFVERYEDMSDDADMVTVLGGTNDRLTKLGAWDSNDITTFYGALNTLISGLVNKYPGKPIIFFTPIRQAGGDIVENPWDELQGKGATATVSLQLRAEAIKHKCLQYGVVCVDLFNISGINGLDTNRAYYRENDATHPSAIGQKRLASVIMTALEEYARFLE